MENDKPILENSVTDTEVTEYEKKEKTDAENTEKKEDAKSPAAEEAKEEKTDSETEAKEDDDKKKKKDDYTLNSSVENANVVSVEEYNTLKDKYTALEETVAALTKFKNEVELEKKKALVNEFTMLADEDKADIVKNFDKYSLDEIESQLSIKCFRKGIFNKTEEAKIDTEVETTKSDPITTYSLPNTAKSNVPDWI